MAASSRARYQGEFVGDRASANACIDVAVARIASLLEARRDLSADTAGNANRLNDYVRDVLKALRNAEKLLEQRGEAA